MSILGFRPSHSHKRKNIIENVSKNRGYFTTCVQSYSAISFLLVSSYIVTGTLDFGQSMAYAHEEILLNVGFTLKVMVDKFFVIIA